MPNNLELALLSRVIQDGDFHTLDKAQLTKEYFTTPEAIEIFNYLRNIYYAPQTMGDVPSLSMVQLHYPSFYPFPTTDSVAVLADQLRKEKIKLDILTLAQNLSTEADKDPIAALATLRARTAEISTLEESGEDLSMAAAHNMLLANYQKVEESGGLLGIPYPWKPLNDETQGKQNGQFIVLYGRPKSMKTWLAIWMAIYSYIFCRKRVLYYTREMPPRQVAQRVAAGIARVDYRAYQQGKLPQDSKQHVFTILQELMADEISAGASGNHQPYFKIISDRRKGSKGEGGGIGWLQAKIREMQPDEVYVDGMYLMKDDRTNSRSVDWKNITHISQDLKLTAGDFDIPVIGVTQANRAAEKSKGEDLTELAYADALGQDADAVFRVSRKKKIDEATKQRITELTLTAPGLREGEFDGIVLTAKPAISFEFARILTTEDERDGAKGYGDSEKRFRRTFSDPRIPAPAPIR